MPNATPNLELATKYAGFTPYVKNATDDCNELFALLDEGVAAMHQGGGRPTDEVFAKLKKDFGYDDV